MRTLLITFLFLFLLRFSCLGQNTPTISRDTLNSLEIVDSPTDSTISKKKGLFYNIFKSKKYPNPTRSAALSFVLPGAGQIYNKKYWYIKVPIIYSAYAGLIYLGEGNRREKNRYQKAYLLALDGQQHEFSNTIYDSPERLRIRRNGFDKNFQLSYIGLVLFHVVQTLEAYTAAHLINFDVDENLSLRPSLHPNLDGQLNYTLQANITF